MKFVYCFQPGLGHQPPFLAEFISQKGSRCTIKVSKKQHSVHRACCSTIPFTKAELEKYKPAAKEEKINAKAVGAKGFT